MTEAEWLTSNDLASLLDFVQPASIERKLRLFVCGCCRSAWSRLNVNRVRRAVESGERYADELETTSELLRIQTLVRMAAWEARPMDRRGEHEFRYTASYKTPEEARRLMAAESVAEKVNFRLIQIFYRDGEYGEIGPKLLRDIFGNPFRPVSFDPCWRTSTAVALAQGMYESRDFSAMPILADALQDAGCEHADILTHCRDEKQVHVRGCWVVDLVLGKE